MLSLPSDPVYLYLVLCNCSSVFSWIFYLENLCKFLIVSFIFVMVKDTLLTFLLKTWELGSYPVIVLSEMMSCLNVTWIYFTTSLFENGKHFVFQFIILNTVRIQTTSRHSLLEYWGRLTSIVFPCQPIFSMSTNCYQHYFSFKLTKFFT